MVSLRCAAIAATAAVALTPQVADACGGFFAPPTFQVVQTGERIAFAIDPTGQVDVIVNIDYSGSADAFGWVVPLSQAPSQVQVAPSRIFAELDRAMAPTLQIDNRTEGTCQDRGLNLLFGGSEDVALGGVPTVSVIQQENVGPFEFTVLDAETAEQAEAWLQQNDYVVPAGGRSLLASYLQAGDVLFALRLRNGAAVESIQPIWITMPSAGEACVPLRLTAIASDPNLDVVATVFSTSRAVPENYLHVEPNWARLDWGGDPSAGYAQLLSEAFDEAGGQAFTTEFAGRTPGTRLGIPRDLGGALQSEDLAQFMSAVRNLGLTFDYPEALPIIQSFIPQGALNSSGVVIENIPLDPSPIVEALQTRLLDPEREFVELIAGLPYATRLHTILSPEEMSLDPIFSFRSDLPDVSNQRTATFTAQCGFGGEANGPFEVEVDGFRFELSDRADRIDADMPAAALIEQLADGDVVSDRRTRIQEALDGANGCSAVGAPTLSWLLLGAAAARLRRRSRLR